MVCTLYHLGEDSYLSSPGYAAASSGEGPRRGPPGLCSLIVFGECGLEGPTIIAPEPPSCSDVLVSPAATVDCVSGSADCGLSFGSGEESASCFVSSLELFSSPPLWCPLLLPPCSVFIRSAFLHLALRFWNQTCKRNKDELLVENKHR